MPTPVSALIHAATMVTAGVYLLMRTSPLIEYSSTVLILCLWLGAITTVFSSLIGLFQQDIKKVIAYSTMSQLGMMVIAVGLSSYNIALFHLVNHAFYKGLLFLGAGAVIHAVADNQDFRKYGGLRPFLPLTYSVMLIASLSLVAFPFMTGFYSKDFILESAYGQFYFSGTVVYFIATIGAIFTTLYSVKVLYLTFLTNPNGPVVNYKQAHEGDIFMSLPLIILAIFSIFFGYITKDMFIGLGSGFFADNSLFIHPTHEIMLDTEFAVPTLFKLLPLIFTISFSTLAVVLSEFLPKIMILFKFTRLGYNIFGFFNQRFLIELFYNKYITGLVLNLGGQTTKVIDKGSVELLGPFGLEKGLINLSRNIASLDTGVITSYALYILIGLISYLLIPYLFLTDNSLLLLILLAFFSIITNKWNKTKPFLPNNENKSYVPTLKDNISQVTSFSFGRNLRKAHPVILSGKGNILFTNDKREIFDASTGAAVSCLGHGNKRVINAVHEQMKTGTPYLSSTFWSNGVVEDLCKELISGTNGKMARVYLASSGSEAMEATIKVSRQYFCEVDKQTPRVNFIARENSYHGNTIGALSISGHRARRAPYTPFLMDNVHHVSSCNSYRQRIEGESDAAFVDRKATELEAKFQELGAETVIGFIAEPVVGAALGCVPYVPGYLKAMRDVCHKHGGLFILDEVMCGMGRTGTLHAWQAEGVVPDIQTMGKGLGAGYQSIAAMMVSQNIVNVLIKGSGQFVHGQTYQSMPVQAAAALEVQRIIREDKLMNNVIKQGAYLEKRLKAVLGDHPNVGDIRGRGLFWGLEFVKDKMTKEPFDSKLGVAQKILDLAISPPFNMTVYPGTGTVDGVRGDHIIIAPSYIVTEKDVDHIVKVISAVVHIIFNNIGTSSSSFK